MHGFHVDRAASLHDGDTLALQKVMPAPPFDVSVISRLDADFPDGLSRFGIAQFFNRSLISPPDGKADQLIELVFELVRRLEFAQQPSRLATVYACPTADDARAMCTTWIGDWPNALIWEIEGQQASSPFDTALLGVDGTAWEAIERARRYWRGEATAAPVWELLFAPPVTVISRVDP